MGSELVCEFTDSRGQQLAVDAEKGVIRGVKIIGYESANNRSYPREVLKRAMPLYEGARVNVNHRKNLGEPRDYQERMGSIRSVREGDGGLYGDLHYNPKHRLAEQLAWDAQNDPGSVGLSPVHSVTGRRVAGGKLLIESVESVKSVDLVADPATNKTLYEHREEAAVEIKELTLDKLRELRPDLVSEALAEKSSDDELVTLKAQIKTLSEQVEQHKIKEAAMLVEDEIAKLIGEAKLPEFAITDAFKTTLREAKDADARKGLIADRKSLVESASKNTAGGMPISRERQPVTVGEGVGASGVTNGESFARAIKKRVL